MQNIFVAGKKLHLHPIYELLSFFKKNAVMTVAMAAALITGLIVPVDADHFNANVNVAVSDPFFGWVFALGDKIKIVGPESVKEQMKEAAKRVYEQYIQ